MKKSTVIILSLLIVYSECWVIKDILKGAKETADDVLSAIRPTTTEDLPSSSTVETLLKHSTEVSTLPEEITTSKLNLISDVTTENVVSTTIEGRVAINAKERCPSGFQKDPSGACKPVFG
uniref:Putative secreted protein n=1 Tax=Panstrongylus lignarius TaxID=156445 RepID=A0A224XPK4_9HEMI